MRLTPTAYATTSLHEIAVNDGRAAWVWGPTGRFNAFLSLGIWFTSGRFTFVRVVGSPGLFAPRVLR